MAVIAYELISVGLSQPLPSFKCDVVTVRCQQWFRTISRFSHELIWYMKIKVLNFFASYLMPILLYRYLRYFNMKIT